MKAGTRRRAFSTASIALIAVSAGCAGAGTNASPPLESAGFSNPAAARVDAQKTGKARIVVAIPRAKADGIDAPEYVSASTQSMVVRMAGQSAQTFALGAGASGCATRPAGFVTCSEIATLPAGSDKLTATLYDGPKGKGDALSVASATVKILAGKVTKLEPAFAGVVVRAKVLLNGAASASFSAGTRAALKVGVDAYDAKGGLIAPGAYASAVKLVDNDASGRTSVSPAQATKAGEKIALDYDGGAIAAKTTGTIVPSVDGKAQRAGAATFTIALGKLTAAPASIAFSSASAQTIAVKERGYSGTFSATSSDPTVAIVTAKSKGPSATLTVTPAGGGTCTIVVQDASGQKASVSVSVSSGVIIVSHANVHSNGGIR